MPINEWSEKRRAIFHMLRLLGGQERVYGLLDYFEFSRPVDGRGYYALEEKGRLYLIGQSFYVNRHKGTNEWSDEQKIRLPEDEEERIYGQLREILIDCFQKQIEAEERENEERDQLNKLLDKYGVPDDYDNDT